jgi:hypothetical protein
LGPVSIDEEDIYGCGIQVWDVDGDKELYSVNLKKNQRYMPIFGSISKFKDVFLFYGDTFVNCITREERKYYYRNTYPD